VTAPRPSPERRREALERSDDAAEARFTSMPAEETAAPCDLKDVSWIEVKIVDADGKGVGGRPFRVKGHGKEIRGRVDGRGYAYVDDLEPGEYDVEFPEDEPTAEYGALELFVFDAEQRWCTPSFESEADASAANWEFLLLPEQGDKLWLRYTLLGTDQITEAQLDVRAPGPGGWTTIALSSEQIAARTGWVEWPRTEQAAASDTEPWDWPLLVARLSVTGTGDCVQREAWTAMVVPPPTSTATSDDGAGS